MISESLKIIFDNYLREKSAFEKDKKRPRNLDGFLTFQEVEKNLPKKLLEEAKIPPSSYKIMGSIHNGRLSNNPWVAIFDIGITQSAQSGYYLVYLFKSDMSGVYLSLNQGWTQYEKEYEVKKDQILHIKKNTKIAKSLLNSLYDFNKDNIDLRARRPLGRGYEYGNICSKYYPKDQIPDENIIIDDLRNMLGVYRELKGLVGKSILNITDIESEEEFQNKIQTRSESEISKGPIPKGKKLDSSRASQWSRNQSMSSIAIKRADYMCEFDSNHKTFISDKSGSQFMEAHHLIPIEFQDDFEYSIDVPENIVSLCPNCHREVHFSKLENRAKIILALFEQRASKLREREIVITPDQIMKYYKILEASNND